MKIIITIAYTVDQVFKYYQSINIGSQPKKKRTNYVCAFNILVFFPPTNNIVEV